MKTFYLTICVTVMQPRIMATYHWSMTTVNRYLLITIEFLLWLFLGKIEE